MCSVKWVLVPSFLFVSAVLADYHSEIQQPPFLNRVEKSIDRTTVLLPTTQSAGMVWTTDQKIEEGGVIFAAGTFTLPPRVSGRSGSSFNITVGISASWCTRITLAVGITVTSMGIEGDAHYQAWGAWYPEVLELPSAPFVISAGDKIYAGVELTANNAGAFTLINLVTGQSWGGSVSGHPLPIECMADAQWLIATLPDNHAPLPNFDAVTFVDTVLRVAGMEKQPKPWEVDLFNIKEDTGGQDKTLTVYYHFLIIAYNPSHEETVAYSALKHWVD